MLTQVPEQLAVGYSSVKVPAPGLALNRTTARIDGAYWSISALTEPIAEATVTTAEAVRFPASVAVILTQYFTPRFQVVPVVGVLPGVREVGVRCEGVVGDDEYPRCTPSVRSGSDCFRRGARREQSLAAKNAMQHATQARCYLRLLASDFEPSAPRPKLINCRCSAAVKLAKDLIGQPDDALALQRSSQPGSGSES